MKQTFYLIALIYLFGCNNQSSKPDATLEKSNSSTAVQADPLPSWNDGTLKKAILDYVQHITDSSKNNFIPQSERIAAFDNDGTLWAERPYVQELFAFYMVKKMASKNPTLAKKQPFKAVIEHDKTYFEKGGERALIELMAVTHTNMKEDEFETYVNDFFASGTYPKYNVPFKQITYQPQIELLNYLRRNGFKIFICTGGTVEFVRGISSAFYGIPKEQVIGTSFQYEFIDSSNTINRKPALGSFNDKLSKPANIQLHIGQRPVFACGNEGGAGDIAMLEYSQTSKHLSFQMLVNHNDSVREFYYQEKDNASLNAARKNNWHVISMKEDWKEIFAE